MSTDLGTVSYVESFFLAVPVWLSRANGRKYLAAPMLLLDLGLQVLIEALYARFPGLGTNTALPLLGHDRGMIRGMTDTDQSFASHLIQWLDRHRLAGGMLGLARALQDYMGGNPRIKIVNRYGRMLDLQANGGPYTVSDITWNWDSKSNPLRAGFWSEIWIVVYVPPWPIQGTLGTDHPTDFGLGQKCPRFDVDNTIGLLQQWKSAHTFVRCLIFSYDATLFDPSSPSTMPDGTWGRWSYGAQHCQASGRTLKEQANKIRCWEPQREPSDNLLVAP